MKIKAEIICSKCKREVKGHITLNQNNQVIDSDGFMIFANESICDTCLDDIDHKQNIIKSPD